MSVLVVGLSHKSAPVATLARAVVGGDDLTKLLRDVSQAGSVAGAFVVSACSRVEVYAEVDKFHGGVASISELLARHSGLPLSELTPHLYVHYEDRAVQHLLAVACGLESMVVGESQILGQVRQALSVAREHGTLSRGLGELGTLALRTARPAHAETRIDQPGAHPASHGLPARRARGGGAGAAGGPQPGAGGGRPGRPGARRARPIPRDAVPAGAGRPGAQRGGRDTRGAGPAGPAGEPELAGLATRDADVD